MAGGDGDAAGSHQGHGASRIRRYTRIARLVAHGEAGAGGGIKGEWHVTECFPGQGSEGDRLSELGGRGAGGIGEGGVTGGAGGADPVEIGGHGGAAGVGITGDVRSRGGDLRPSSAAVRATLDFKAGLVGGVVRPVQGDLGGGIGGDGEAAGSGRRDRRGRAIYVDLVAADIVVFCGPEFEIDRADGGGEVARQPGDGDPGVEAGRGAGINGAGEQGEATIGGDAGGYALEALRNFARGAAGEHVGSAAGVDLHDRHVVAA